MIPFKSLASVSDSYSMYYLVRIISEIQRYTTGPISRFFHTPHCMVWKN